MAMRSTIPIILSPKGGKPLLPVVKTLVCRSQGLKPRPPAQEADAAWKNLLFFFSAPTVLYLSLSLGESCRTVLIECMFK